MACTHMKHEFLEGIDMEATEARCNLLFVPTGAGESGKSTIVKQMK